MGRYSFRRVPICVPEFRSVQKDVFPGILSDLRKRSGPGLFYKFIQTTGTVLCAMTIAVFTYLETSSEINKVSLTEKMK